MRRLALLLALAAALAVSGCGGEGEEPAAVRLTLTEGGSSRSIDVRSWSLPRSGRVIGLGGTPGELFVAQRLGLSRLDRDGSSKSVFEAPAKSSIVALSPRGRRVAVEDDEGIRAGAAVAFDPDSTALAGYYETGQPIVLDGYPARIFEGRLWDLARPKIVWSPTIFGDFPAIDPTQRLIAMSEEEGNVVVISAASGEEERSVPRRSAGRIGVEVGAIAVAADGEVASLDRAGWASCEAGSLPLFPLAPPGMPAALAFDRNGFWAMRGGMAIFTTCGPGTLQRRCEIQGENGDPRSSALLAGGGRVYAAGLERDRVVLLPRCG